jgi:AcrR family transcriptional regulator
MNRPASEKHRKIIKAALQAFARYGFDKATIKRIAGEAGLSTTSLIYWYFKDKNELFQAVLSEMSPLVGMAADAADLIDRPPEEVLPLVARTLLDTYDNPDMAKLARIFISEAAQKPEVGTQFAKSGIMTVLSFLVDYLRRQVNLGRLRPHDPQSAARAFMGTLIIYPLGRELFPPLRDDLPDKDRYIQEATAIFLRGLRA